MVASRVAQQILVKPETKVRLNDYDPKFCGDASKSDPEYQTEMNALREAMNELQQRLYAEHRQSLLVVLQAMDTGGKDGTIRHVFGGLNPQGCQVTSFKAPNYVELAHDFLWRIHEHTPRRGQIAIFNRSHYEDVLVVRVHKLVSEKVWRKRYDQINAFEEFLAEHNTRIVKFFLHISKKEQKERLQARLDDPTKHWKFSTSDLEERGRWDDYMEAYEDALSRCSTEYAPWHIIPADHKWYRNLVIAQIIEKTMRDMDPRWPDVKLDVDSIAIPD